MILLQNHTMKFKVLGYRRKEKSKFVRVAEVATLLDVSKPHAYKIMRELNRELSAKGMIVTSGRLSRRYLDERMYC